MWKTGYGGGLARVGRVTVNTPIFPLNVPHLVKAEGEGTVFESCGQEIQASAANTSGLVSSDTRHISIASELFLKVHVLCNFYSATVKDHGITVASKGPK